MRPSWPLATSGEQRQETDFYYSCNTISFLNFKLYFLFKTLEFKSTGREDTLEDNQQPRSQYGLPSDTAMFLKLGHRYPQGNPTVSLGHAKLYSRNTTIFLEHQQTLLHK